MPRPFMHAPSDAVAKVPFWRRIIRSTIIGFVIIALIHAMSHSGSAIEIFTKSVNDAAFTIVPLSIVAAVISAAIAGILFIWWKNFTNTFSRSYSVWILINCVMLGIGHLSLPKAPIHIPIHLTSAGAEKKTPPMTTEEFREVAAPRGPDPFQPSYIRSSLSPRGTSWPAGPGYVPGYLIQSREGSSTVTIDNTQGGADVFLKIHDLERGTPFAPRICFVPAGSSFTMESISPGAYDIRFRNLDTGKYYRSEPFVLWQTSAKYSTYSLTLYRVDDGNTETTEIDGTQF